MGFFFALFIFSVPVFYILGVIYFGKQVGFSLKSKETRRIEKIHEIINQLTVKLQADPTNKELQTVLTLYQDELKMLDEQRNGRLLPEAASTISQSKGNTKSVTTPPPPPPTKKAPTEAFSSWYSDNSINAFLYLGAFLIVASAVTFVSFQWEVLSGLAKASLLTMLNLAFFGVGVYLYRIEKVRQAATTFAFISAALIPFSGIAWYNFYLHDFGLVWTLTSLVAIVVYAFFIYYLKNRTFTYLTSISLYSAVASFVPTLNQPSIYYIFAGIITSMLLQMYQYLRNRFLEEPTDEEQQLYKDIRSIADIISLFSLLYGALFSISVSQLDSLELLIMSILTGIYFFLQYLQTKNDNYMVIVSLIKPLALAIFCGWLELSTLTSLYLFTLLSVVYLGYGFYFHNREKRFVDPILAIGLFIGLVVFFISLISINTPIHWVRLGYTPFIFGITIAYLKRQPLYLLLSVVMGVIELNLIVSEVLRLPDRPYLTLSYLLVGLVAYTAITFVYRKYNRDLFITTLITTVLFLFLNATSSTFEGPYFMLTTFTWILLALHAGLFFGEKWLLYLSNFSLVLFSLTTLNHFTVSTDYRPLILTGIFASLYAVSKLAKQEIRDVYLKSSLIGLIAFPILFFSTVNIYAILSGYLALAIFVIEARQRKTHEFSYGTAALGLLLYLWQMAFWNMEEGQIYTLPVALYLLIIGYFEMKRGKESNTMLLNLIGFFALIFPTLSQALQINGAQYALLLGIEGIVLLVVANSFGSKDYRYAGITAIVLATISQLYEYVLSLPRWIIMGMVGLLFLFGALYLLVKRPEEKEN